MSFEKIGATVIGALVKLKLERELRAASLMLICAGTAVALRDPGDRVALAIIQYAAAAGFIAGLVGFVVAMIRPAPPTTSATSRSSKKKAAEAAAAQDSAVPP